MTDTTDSVHPATCGCYDCTIGKIAREMADKDATIASLRADLLETTKQRDHHASTIFINGAQIESLRAEVARLKDPETYPESLAILHKEYRRQIAELKERWRDVRDGLPTQDGLYAVRTHADAHDREDFEVWGWLNSYGWQEFTDEVTHWFALPPLPEPPK